MQTTDAAAACSPLAGLRAGKPVWSDLRNRRPALPVLLTHRLGGRAERAVFAEPVDGAADGDGHGQGYTPDRAPAPLAAATPRPGGDRRAP